MTATTSPQPGRQWLSLRSLQGSRPHHGPLSVHRIGHTIREPQRRTPTATIHGLHVGWPLQSSYFDTPRGRSITFAGFHLTSTQSWFRLHVVSCGSPRCDRSRRRVGLLPGHGTVLVHVACAFCARPTSVVCLVGMLARSLPQNRDALVALEAKSLLLSVQANGWERIVCYTMAKWESLSRSQLG